MEHLGDAQGTLVVDEAGFLKTGARSDGMQRQPNVIGGANMAPPQKNRWPDQLRRVHNRLEVQRWNTAGRRAGTPADGPLAGDPGEPDGWVNSSPNAQTDIFAAHLY